MLEIKSVQVTPSNEEATIQLWQNFGWQFVSSQEVNNTDSHLERRGDEIYNVTTKEHYVKLVFNREKNHPNYNQIVKLENEYYSILRSKPSVYPGGNGFVAFILLMWLIFPGVIYIVVTSKKKKASQAAFANWQRKANTRISQILQEAESLL